MFNAEFELTNRCNTRCAHCPHEVMSRPSGRLDWGTFKIVTGKIRDHVKGERFSLQFSGMGEALLNPEVARFIKHVSADAITSFSTNGVALTERNIAKLIEAGLDQIYFSFNGDEPQLFAKMMGGLSFERVLSNLRNTIRLARGTRLAVWANISVTKANRDRLTSITQLLTNEGIAGLCYSMAHTRGGSLRDPSVFDTPPLPADVTHCEVLSNTLFIDWRGRAFICDHDIHGEHSLGDLVTESLDIVLERRQRLIDNGVNFRVCGECNDVLKMGVNFCPINIPGHSVIGCMMSTARTRTRSSPAKVRRFAGSTSYTPANTVPIGWSSASWTAVSVCMMKLSKEIIESLLLRAGCASSN